MRFSRCLAGGEAETVLGAGSLRCRAGWHAPRGGGVWNHGYCFTACARCGRDMVRSAFGEWHVPRGFRVVANGDAGAVAAFDAAMMVRDHVAAAPLPVVAVERPVQPIRQSAPLRSGQVASPGSPFDFEDFDAVDPTTAIFVDAIPQSDPATPSLSRAVP